MKRITHILKVDDTNVSVYFDAHLKTHFFDLDGQAYQGETIESLIERVKLNYQSVELHPVSK